MIFEEEEKKNLESQVYFACSRFETYGDEVHKKQKKNSCQRFSKTWLKKFQPIL